jgi:predicted dehydrogenase
MVCITRRQLIRTGAAGMATLATTRPARPAPAARGANERIRVGIIGPGDRGTDLLKQFFRVAAAHNADLVAVCDLWSVRREQATGFVAGRTGKAPAAFRNIEELLDARAVDAVFIATPDFSHAILCAQAVRAGLDVYVEKPLAHVMEDARLVRTACLETGRVVQMGTNGRSEGRQRAAVEFVKSGQLGKIVGAELGWHVNQPMRWRRDALVARLREADTDWKRYQLNRPPRAFDPRRYLEFRLFWPYSSGLPDQWMSHHMDAVAQVTGELYPASCVASGHICQWHDGRENADTFAAVFEYASGFQVRYSARHTNGYGGHFQRFFSTTGTLDIGTGTMTPDAAGQEPTTAPATINLPNLPDESHVGNWLECLRTRRQPVADVHAGYAHSVAVAMAVRAMQTGRRVGFDPTTDEIREA